MDLFLPVFCIILIWGIASFIYTLDAMIQQWNETAILKLQWAAHLIEMSLLRPVELIELMYKTIPSGQSPLFNEMVTSALEDLNEVVNVSFTYAGEKSPLPMKESTGMPWKQTRAYRHSRVVAVSHPEYDTDAGGTTFTLVLNLLDDQKQMLGILELIMRFSTLIDDIHLDRLEWFKHGTIL